MTAYGTNPIRRRWLSTFRRRAAEPSVAACVQGQRRIWPMDYSLGGTVDHRGRAVCGPACDCSWTRTRGGLAMSAPSNEGRDAGPRSDRNRGARALAEFAYAIVSFPWA